MSHDALISLLPIFARVGFPKGPTDYRALIVAALVFGITLLVLKYWEKH